MAGLLLFGLALALRSFEAPFVFVGADTLLDPWDGAYHARRAFFTFAEFPRLLVFDPYLRFPDGAAVPFPPLYDWLIGAVAWLLATDAAGFTRVAAWCSPVLSALTLVPIHLATRRIFDGATAWWACLLAAVFPASVLKAGLGDLDHHAAVALWVACAFYYMVCLADDRAHDRRSIATWSGIGALLRISIATSWTGSLLVLALFEVSALVVAISKPSSRLFRLQTIATLVSTFALALIVAALPTPIGGPFSSTELSGLHVIVMFAASLLWLALGIAQRRSPLHSGRAVISRVTIVAGALGIALLAIPPVRAALLPGVDFVAGADEWAPHNAEQAPLFSWLGGEARMAGDSSNLLFGYAAWLIPLLPFVPRLHGISFSTNAAALLFALWSVVLGALAVAQVRFGSEFAPIASMGIAGIATWGVGLAMQDVRRASREVHVLATGLVIALSMIPVWKFHLAQFDYFHAARKVETGDYDRALLNPDSALIRFAETVRRATPETSGYLDPDAAPEYAVLALPSFGHAIHWASRRPTPANNFGPYLDAEKMRLANRFFGTTDELEALAIVDTLRARFVVTSEARWLRPERVVGALHRRDGETPGRRGSVRGLRLIAESTPGSKPSFIAFGANPPAGIIPYKLWERVPGATIEASIEPGAWLEVELPLTTKHGRRFRYRAGARADAAGLARLDLPYASEARHDVRALAPYTVRSGNRTARLRIAEDDVLSGRSLTIRWE